MNTKTLLNIATAITLIAITASNLGAQDWKAAKKKADDFYAKGDYPKAGDAYMAAYKDKNKQEFAEKAAECYTISREYTALAAAMEPLRSEKTERAGFKYANALKQSGKYTDAIREFQLYINNHKGKDYDKEERYVQMQIEGCHLALKQQKETAKVAAPVRIPKLCSEQTDYAPTLVGTHLYYAAMSNGLSTIFTAEKNTDIYSKPSPLAFAKNANTHYGHPTVTEDGSRMYFTACTNAKGAKPTCQIYGMEQKNGKWSDPSKLPDFINLKDANTTQPFVTVVDKKEQLYFVSDRKGGQGGLDIWVATRNTEAEGYAFTLPMNLGASLNTIHDDITPRYKDFTLYFASDGYIGLGGFDVFSAKKKAVGWELPKNLGMPINSPADDTYYTPLESEQFFMVSNRIVKNEKASSADDDIFSNGTIIVTNASEMSKLSGKITDAATGKSILGVMFSLIDEISGKEILTKTCNGTFDVQVYPSMKYRLDARKEGYKTATQAFLSADAIADVVQNIEMTRIADYKGNMGTIGNADPIEQVSDITDEKVVGKIEPTINTDLDIKLEEPVEMPIADAIESTIFYGDLSPEEKARIVTIGDKKVLPEPSGNKIVSMEPLTTTDIPEKVEKVEKVVESKPKPSEKPILADKSVKIVSKSPKDKTKPVGNKQVSKPITPDDEDASNDADGAALSAGDTKEGTMSGKIPAKKPLKKGTSFKVQLASLGAKEQFVASKYDFATKLGATIETEPGPNGIGTRIIANPTNGNADDFMKKLKASGKSGFKVKYADGVRL